METGPVRLVGELSVRPKHLGPKGIAVAKQLLLGEGWCVCVISSGMTLVTGVQTPTPRAHLAV